MTATIERFCSISGLTDLKTILIPEGRTRQEKLQDDDWDNRWNWDTTELVLNDDDDNDEKKKHTWLSECKIAVSPLMDTMVLGRNKILTILNLKCSPATSSSSLPSSRKQQSDSEARSFDLMYNTSLPGLSPDETITSIGLLPFYARQRTLVSVRDWTAILVGFSSGYFRIYSENGKVLVSHLFHDGPIHEIKIRTHCANPMLAEHIDQILLFYSDSVIQIDGFTLYQTLRACRASLARSTVIDSAGLGYYNYNSDGQQHSSGNSNSGMTGGSEAPFTFKKWRFETASDGSVRDCVEPGHFMKNDFDALVSHTISGHNRLGNDNADLFVTTGIHPFVGFYRAQEGESHTIIDELGAALMNKVKNVFSFFSQAKPKENDPRENIKPSKNVDCNIGLYDERLGLKICLSPNRRLAAVVDDFGRVILFDIQNAIPIRMWKGYRKAEVGWIVSDENNDNESASDELFKCAHFLVIHAPKRAIIEIWSAQNGPRVGAFRVGKNCRLLYLDHVMFGLNHLILKQIKQTMSRREFVAQFFQTKCMLLNFDNGDLHEIRVPFLCSLTDRNSKKTRDIHIVKDIKNILTKDSANELQSKQQQKLSSDCVPMEDDSRQKFRSEVVRLFGMLKTAEMRREALDELIQLSTDEHLILQCSNKLREDLNKLVSTNEADFENKLVLQMAVRVIQVCETFIFIQANRECIRSSLRRLIEQAHSPPDIHQLTSDLGGWSANDVARILSLLAFRESVLKTQSENGTISESEIDLQLSIMNEFTIREMLSHFTLYYSHLVKRAGAELYDRLPIEIILMNDSDSTAQTSEPGYSQSGFVSFNRLSKFMFLPAFCGERSIFEWIMNSSCIFPSNLLFLLFTSWLECDSSLYWPSWKSFSAALFKIVDVVNDMRDVVESSVEATDAFQSEASVQLFTELFDSSSFDDRLLATSWTDIIELIYKSCNVTSALIAVNMIKSLINKFKLSSKDIEELNLNKDSELLAAENDNNDGTVEDEPAGRTHDAKPEMTDVISTKSIVSSGEDWETLHLDKENLCLLTKQLEDLFLLDMLLKSSFNRSARDMSDSVSYPFRLPEMTSTMSNNSGSNPKQSSHLSVTTTKFTSISLSLILTSGPGIVSEIVACWAVYHRIPAELLICSPGVDASELDSEPGKVAATGRKSKSPESGLEIANENLKRTIEDGSNAVSDLSGIAERGTLLDVLEHVRGCFPNCLDSDILLINCFWELLLQWHHSPLIHSTLLPLTLPYLSKVSSAVLKHNVACMGWRLFIQRRLETLCGLIDKMGKKPKDRICRKELDMDENTVEQFINYCCEMVDFMITTSFSGESEALPLFTLDEWWRGFNSASGFLSSGADNESAHLKYAKQLPLVISDGSHVPLASMAVAQKGANLDLLVQYYHLTLSVQFVIAFSLKACRPLQLFPSSIRAYFFKDLHTFLFGQESGSDSVLNDSVLNETRHKFLDSVILAIVQTLPVYREERDRSESSKFYLIANKWYSKTILLAREWNLNVDRVRLTYVVTLFLCGCDPLGQELIPTVSNVRTLSHQLLRVCGMRMLALLTARFGTLDEISFLPPNILFWLKSLVTDPNCFLECPLDSTVFLLEQVCNLLACDEENEDVNYRICREMLDATKILQ